MPTHAHLSVREGERVHAGSVLAKIPRATTKTKDITGGLPRVVELFEARKPRETAVMSEINGTVKIGDVVKGVRKVKVMGDDGNEREYSVPPASTSTSRRASASTPAIRSWTVPATPTTFSRSWAKKNSRNTWSMRCRRSTACRASTSTTSTSKSSAAR